MLFLNYTLLKMKDENIKLYCRSFNFIEDLEESDPKLVEEVQLPLQLLFPNTIPNTNSHLYPFVIPILIELIKNF